MAEDRLTAPKPLEEHRKLAAFAGDWNGEETVYGSRWVEGGQATSRVTAGSLWLPTSTKRPRGTWRPP